MINFLFIVLSSLLSGLIGVIITNHLHFKNEKIKFKRNIALQLIANRHDLRGELFTQALNSIMFAFNDDDETVQKFKIFTDEVFSPHKTEQSTNQKILDLIKAMLKGLKMDTSSITDNYLLIAFNPKIQ